MTLPKLADVRQHTRLPALTLAEAATYLGPAADNTTTLRQEAIKIAARGTDWRRLEAALVVLHHHRAQRRYVSYARKT